MSIADLTNNFKKFQNQRIQIYREFEASFKEYQQTGIEEEYTNKIKSITVAFSECSIKIRNIEQEFRNINKNDIGDIIRAIQLLEKEKLEITIQLQLLKKERSVNFENEDHEKNFSVDKSIKEKSKRIAEIINDINDKIEDIKYATQDEEQ